MPPRKRRKEPRAVKRRRSGPLNETAGRGRKGGPVSRSRLRRSGYHPAGQPITAPCHLPRMLPPLPRRGQRKTRQAPALSLPPPVSGKVACRRRFSDPTRTVAVPTPSATEVEAAAQLILRLVPQLVESFTPEPFSYPP